ncbi:MAG TPA: beta-ketoacyl-ACP synthase III [Acidimicrobiia bacterium]|nr:beta-ketoacyl-ACP synthase III [Acidimicrobiia bacterium]
MTALPVGIVGWGTAVPDGRLTNADLEARVDTSDAWIRERTGITERRIAGDGESTASLGTEAARNALKQAGLEASDIDLLIVATATPEQPIPHTGAFIGDNLGLRCGSFDLAAACAGFTYELIVGSSMVNMGYERVLIVGAETLTRITDPADRTTIILFGDGAGAAVLAPVADGAPALLAWDLGCDGSAAGLLQVPAGGSRRPATAATIAAGDHYLKMQGQNVFKQAVRAVVASANATLERAGVASSDVDWFVPHQANARIIDAAGARLDIPAERTLVNIERYGNTSSASIPLALFEGVDDGRVQPGDVVLLSGFGAGMTWASALLRWTGQ